MRRSPYVLAALLSAALPGVEPVRARLLPGGTDLDEAVVEDSTGGRWLVRAPRDAKAGAALEREAALLATLADGPALTLPFEVPVVVGSTALEDGGRAVVQRVVPGSMLDTSALAPGGALTTSLGRALAALHDLTPTVVTDAGLPAYEAGEYRQRRLSELDRAAGTGLVPSVLLTRWERGLEDVAAWRFAATVVHGDVAAENVLTGGSGPDWTVTAVIGWGEAQVADPADDLAWLVAGEQDVFDAVLSAYRAARATRPDEHLAARAALAGELALARWLLHGVTADDADVVADAARMLRDLESATAGGPA